MNKGVVLLLFGNNTTYTKWAYNLILTLRHYSPDISIQLIYEEESIIGYEWILGMVDVQTKVEGISREDHLSIPAKAKLSWHEHNIFEQAIYLDVDGIIIKDIEPLFDECAKIGGYVTQIKDFNPSTGEEGMSNMLWAERSKVWQHFGLLKEMQLPSSNSSFQYLEKGHEAILNGARGLLLEHELPMAEHRMFWGRGKHQPDELYLNVSCAINFHKQPIFEPFRFRPRTEMGTPESIDLIREYAYGIGLYGTFNNNHSSMYDMYDATVREIAQGRNYFKSQQLMKNKLAALK
jgi:hypothetical protein